MSITAESIQTLRRCTEDWIAGIHAAAHSLSVQIKRRDSNIVQVIEDFEDRQRTLFDDVAEQVLRQQPASIQAFLRQTAVLGRFSADLCDAVLEIENAKLSIENDSAQRAYFQFSILNAQFLLEELARANLFVVRLDDEERWYRYHQRFADFMKAQLSQAEQDALHCRASAWFEAQGLLPEAIEHALAARDLTTAARLIDYSADTPARFRLQLFGQFELRLAGQAISQLYSNKVQALLIYLTVESNRATSRETLLALLWGEYPEQQAQASLRNTLSKLKYILATTADQTMDQANRLHPAPLLSITRQAVQLTFDPARDSIDVLVFDDLLARCQAHSHVDLDHCASCIERLSQAVALYKADFLAGWTVPDSPAFDEWRLLEQEQRHRQMLVALDALIGYHAALGNFDQVQQYARCQLALEPWHEQAHWQLMRALAAMGERTAALAQYESYRAILWDELAVEPDQAIQHLADEIRTAHPHDQRTGIDNSDEPPPLHAKTLGRS